MGDEPQRQYPNERRRWDDTDGNLRLSVPVREYIDREIKREIQHEREMAAERQRYSEREFVTIEEARRLAKVEQDRRLESMNEFREQLNSQAATFVTRDMMAAESAAIRETIKPLVKAADRSEGSAGTLRWFAPSGPVIVSSIISVISFGIAVLALLQ